MNLYVVDVLKRIANHAGDNPAQDAASALSIAFEHASEIERLTLDLQSSHALTRELNDQMVRLQQDNRNLNEQLNEAQSNYQFMVDRAANEKLDGYRELGAKCALLEERAEKAEAELAQAKNMPVTRKHEVEFWNDAFNEVARRLKEAEAREAGMVEALEKARATPVYQPGGCPSCLIQDIADKALPLASPRAKQILEDAARYRWLAANPGDRASLEWLEADTIDAYIDEQRGVKS
jgi:DNA repair exonuclease SbcCD ATPase subunit